MNAADTSCIASKSIKALTCEDCRDVPVLLSGGHHCERNLAGMQRGDTCVLLQLDTSWGKIDETVTRFCCSMSASRNASSNAYFSHRWR